MGKLSNSNIQTKATQPGKHSDHYVTDDLSVIRPTPTVFVEDFSSDDKEVRRTRKDSISSTKSDSQLLAISPIKTDKCRRSRSTDNIRRNHKNSTLKRTSSTTSVDSDSSSTSVESECTCVPIEERKCEINGSQLSPFYALWKLDNKKTISKKIEQPRFMRRSSEYRQCGCKTREYEKQCSLIKQTTCIQHGI